MLVEELVPMVDATYRTLADRDHRASAGASMGGMQAFGFGLKHQDPFSSICAISAPVFGRFDVKAPFDQALADSAALNAKARLLRLGFGSVEAFAGGIKSWKSSVRKNLRIIAHDM